MRVKRNDQVIVLSGEYRGKKGKVLKAFPKQNRVIVEGVNFIKRHMRPSQQMPQGGIVEKEAPIHASNVILVDPKSGEPTRIRYEFLSSEGKNSRRKVRMSQKSGEMIPDESKS